MKVSQALVLCVRVLGREREGEKVSGREGVKVSQALVLYV